MKPIIFLFSFLLIANSSHAQILSRLLAQVDSGGLNTAYDSIYFKYVGDRGNVRGHNYYFGSYLQYDTAIGTLAGQSFTADTFIRTYDTKNNLVKNIHTYMDGPSYYRQLRTELDTFAYDTQGNIISHLSRTDNWVYQTTFVYNASNLLTTVIEVDDYTSFIQKSKGEYYYNTNNQLDSVIFYSWNGTWVKASKRAYEYSGSLIARYYTQQLDPPTNTWTNNDMKAYGYNGNRLVSDSNFYGDQYQWHLNGCITYDTSSFQSVTTTRQWDPSTLLPFIYEVDSSIYNSNNKLSTKFTKRYKGTSGALLMTIKDVNLYDVVNNLTSTLSYIDTGTGIYLNDSKFITTYDYLNQPVIIHRYSWSFKTNSWKLYGGNEPYYSHYYYDYYWPTSVTPGHKTDAQLVVYPSPANGIINIRLSLEQQTHCKFAITDMHGRLFRQWVEHINSGDTERSIPIPELSTGNYLLQCTTDDDKISKQFSVVR